MLLEDRRYALTKVWGGWSKTGWTISLKMSMKHWSKAESASDGALRGFGAISPVWFCFSFCAETLLISAPAFLGRDNVIEVALGLIIGAAFSNVVTSLVSDVILPPISLVSPDSRNLQSHFWVLRQGETADAIYNTVEQAAADGKNAAVTADWLYRSCILGLGYFCAKGLNGYTSLIVVYWFPHFGVIFILPHPAYAGIELYPAYS